MNTNKKKRIFIGVVDICGQVGDFKRAFERLGYKTFTLVFERGEKYLSENKYSFVLNDLYPEFLIDCKNLFYLLIRKFYTFFFVNPLFFVIFFYSTLVCDIYIFIWLKNPRWKFLLWLLKKFHKKIFVMFVGSDVRWKPLAIQDFELNNIEYSPQFLATLVGSKVDLNSTLRTIRICEKYADSISSTPDQSQLSLRPYICLGLPIDLLKIKFNIPNNKIPIVSLGITEPTFKGSYQILEMIKTFQETTFNKFKLIVIENIPHEEVLKILSVSDIFIYSPYGLSAGKFGYEALASGTLLLTAHNANYVKYPPDPPVVDINSRSMIEKLDYYLKNPAEREKIVIKGRKWVEKYCNNEEIYNKILLSLENHLYDIQPTFFRNYAKFDSEYDPSNANEICNKWTSYVMKCRWYHKYIPKGERNGLIF
jgi:glycosyltransferase involved in cell wall biosynthesis